MHVFKRIKPLGWWSLFILMMIPCYFMILLLLDKDSKATEQKGDLPSNEVHAYTKEETGDISEQSNYPGLRLYNELSETDEYTLSISYPLTGSEAIDLSIQSWADEQKALFLEEVKMSGENKTFPSHLNIQVETNDIGNNIYHIILSASHYNGGANGTVHLASFTIDIDQEKHITLQDLFKQTYDDVFVEKISSEIQKEVESNEEYAEFIDSTLLDEVLQNMDEWKWSIHEDSFTMYFDKYEIGPGSLGAITLEISLDRLDSFLREQWKDTFLLQEDEKEDQATEENRDESLEENDHEENNSSHIANYDKYIALTFDDGPQPNVTPRILETLEEYDAIATFFMLGIQVEYYPEIASLVASQGHEIANHTTNHSDLTLLSKEKIKAHIIETNQIIEDATGVKSVLFRPPYGAYNDYVQEIVEELDLTMILWTVDSLDWKNRNANAVYSAVMDDVEVGSNVLMHDIHPTTADALPGLLETLTNEGYQFVTVSQLLELQEQIGPGPF